MLVGGKGTRLRPLTLSAPKPMLPTAGVPFLAHLLSRIRAAGVRRVILGTSYMAETFAKEFGDGDGPRPGAGLRRRGPPVGHRRRHPQRRRAPHAPTRWSCSTATSCPASTSRAVVDRPTATAADVTLHLVRVPDPRAFGCVPTDADGQVRRSWRRPTTRRPTRSTRAATCSAAAVLDAIPAGPTGVGRAGDVPGAAGGGRAGVRARRQRLLAGHGHPGRPRARLAPTSCAASPRPRRCPAPTGEALLLPAARSPTDARCSPAARRSGAA